MKHARRLILAIAGMLLLTGAADASEAAPAATPEESTIRFAYARLSSYHQAALRSDMALGSDTLASPLTIRFELRGFHTGPIGEIRDRSWRDLVTAPSDARVMISRNSYSVNGVDYAVYRAAWNSGSYASVDAASWRVDDVLAIDPERFFDVGSYTSYEVTVTLDGRSRTYRAVALFHDLYGASKDLKPDFIDDVVGLTGEVTHAWGEVLPPFDPLRKISVRTSVHRADQIVVPGSDKPAIAAAEGHGPKVVRPDSPRSGTRTKLTPRANSGPCFEAAFRGEEHHITGGHYGSAGVCFGCAYSNYSTEKVTCGVTVEGGPVYDDGVFELGLLNIGWRHVGAVVGNSSRVDGPTGERVTCTGQAGMGVSECLFTCSIKISVQAGGFAGAETSGGNIHNSGEGFSHYCELEPRCPDVHGGFFDESSSGERCSAGSPILLDLDGDGIQLTDAKDAISFDLDGDGVPEQISWTASGTDDAFLALDRNGDGRFDNGRELFGNFTAQPESPQQNGFLALAEFDLRANGGNGDAIISPADTVFSSLRLWADANRDGVSQQEETRDLASAGVERLHLKYKESRRADEFGNQFRYRAKVDAVHRSAIDHWAWDVFLTTMPRW